MFCTQCGHANRDSARFCAKCGTALAGHAAADALPPQAGATETPPDDSVAGTAVPTSANSNRRNAIVLGSVVLVCALAAAAAWMLTRNATPQVAAPVTGETTPPPIAAAPESTSLPPGPTPEALPPAPGMPVRAPAAKPVVLSEADVRQVVARLQQEPTPLSCQAVAQRIRTDYNTGPVQADDIAKRAYPQLCAATSAAIATTTAYPESANIDRLYEERSAAECAKGLTGLLCREILHNKLCNGRWSANPPPGQSRCLRADSSDPN